MFDSNLCRYYCTKETCATLNRFPNLNYLSSSAGRPEPPGNCSIVNQTADLLQAECDSGHDGGLPQLFVMELFDALDHSLISNVTSRSPSFLVTDLPPGLEMDVVIYAANAKGRSRSSLLHAFTLRSAARRSGIPRYTLIFHTIFLSIVCFKLTWQYRLHWLTSFE